MSRKSRKKRIFPLAALLVLLAAAGYTVGWLYLCDNRFPNVMGEVELFVEPGTDTEELITSICSQAKVKRPGSLYRTFRRKQVGELVKDGHYLISPGATSVSIARMLNNRWQIPVKLTLSGTIRRRSDIAARISRQMMADSASIMKALSDRRLLESFGFDTVTVMAMFLPDTYEMYWNASVLDILEAQKKEYDRFWSEENVRKASAQGLTPMEVSVLASIVSGETNHVPEMPMVASVYLNRLHKGMKLQADPTIAYCFDYKVGRILKRHLQVDSPYNTYKHAGLPPGPICVPSKASLEAVLNPASGNYLYFCADPSFNGTHRFASTYSAHLTNARAFQKALTARTAAKKASK